MGKPVNFSPLNGGRRRHQPVKAPSPLTYVAEDEEAVIFCEKTPSTSIKSSKENNPESSSITGPTAVTDSPNNSAWDRNNRDKMDVDEPNCDPFYELEEFPENEKQSCPICGKFFSTNKILNHAYNCSDFAGVSVDHREPRPLSTRAVVTKSNATRTHQNQFDDDSWGNDPHLPLRMTTINPMVEVESDWEEVDSDSDFEPEVSGKNP